MFDASNRTKCIIEAQSQLSSRALTEILAHLPLVIAMHICCPINSTLALPAHQCGLHCGGCGIRIRWVGCDGVDAQVGGARRPHIAYGTHMHMQAAQSKWHAGSIWRSEPFIAGPAACARASQHCLSLPLQVAYLAPPSCMAACFHAWRRRPLHAVGQQRPEKERHDDDDDQQQQLCTVFACCCGGSGQGTNIQSDVSEGRGATRGPGGGIVALRSCGTRWGSGPVFTRSQRPRGMLHIALCILLRICPHCMSRQLSSFKRAVAQLCGARGPDPGTINRSRAAISVHTYC